MDTESKAQFLLSSRLKLSQDRRTTNPGWPEMIHLQMQKHCNVKSVFDISRF